MEQTQTQLTEAQAIVVVEQGVRREVKMDSQRTLSYCTDAVKLQGFNVRKLAQKAQVRAEDKGETFNADSYQSNVSNANGIMALFEYDIDVFDAWLASDECTSRSLSKIFKQFRELFTEPKEKPVKASPGGENNDASTEEGSATDVPLVDQVLAALEHLTIAELERVVDAAMTQINVPAAA